MKIGTCLKIHDTRQLNFLCDRGSFKRTRRASRREENPRAIALPSPLKFLTLLKSPYPITQTYYHSWQRIEQRQTTKIDKLSPSPPQSILTSIAESPANVWHW
ncbi:MAG: hypothetical protein V7L30_31715 [Nostoc sp.]|uniref:hypothetical protein n=1 Tax=Nostoc sp. TaxID=1180 RepID=UPI002FF67BA5